MYISTYSILLPFVVAVLFWLKSGAKKEYISILSLITFYLAFEIVVSWLRAKGINNLALLIPYIFIETGLIAFLFLSKGGKPSLKRFILLHLSLAILIAIEYLAFKNPMLSASRFWQSLIVLFLIGTWFNESHKLEERKIERLPMFWFALAMLVYFLPTMVIFPFDAQLLTVNLNSLQIIYSVKNLFNILSKILLTVAVVKWI